MEERRFFKVREDVVRHNSELERAGVLWRLSVHDINNGMTVGLKEAKHKGALSDFLLDYQFADVSTARLHMMPGAGGDAGTVKNLSRFALWAKAIETYDSMMSPDVIKRLPVDEIQRLLQRNTIPRIEKVVTPTTNPTLQALLSRFATFDRGVNDGMTVAWSELVAVAKREKWVSDA